MMVATFFERQNSVGILLPGAFLFGNGRWQSAPAISAHYFPFTMIFSSCPGLKNGVRLGLTSTLSPVLGFLPR